MTNNINNNTTNNNRPNRTARNLRLGFVSTRTRSQIQNIQRRKNTQKETLTAGMSDEQTSQANHAYNLILSTKNINFLSDEALNTVMQPADPELSHIDRCEHRILNLKNIAIISSCTNPNGLNIIIPKLILERNSNTNILSNEVMTELVNTQNTESKNNILNMTALKYDVHNEHQFSLLDHSYILLVSNSPALNISNIFRLMNMDANTRIQALQLPTLVHGMNNQQQNDIYALMRSGRIPVFALHSLVSFQNMGSQERFNSLLSITRISPAA